jgi:hypothetical protein
MAHKINKQVRIKGMKALIVRNRRLGYSTAGLEAALRKLGG